MQQKSAETAGAPDAPASCFPGPGPRLTALCLALILLLAGGFRFYAPDWDAYTFQHPDERFLLMTVEKLAWPASPGEYLDEARSPLNPRNRGTDFYPYGALPLTLLKGLSLAAGSRDLADLARLGRGLSAAADTLAAGLVFALAVALGLGAGTGLLAALFYAACVLAIQQAHFFVVDPLASLFSLAALLPLARVQRTGRRRWWALAGLLWGLALACKMSLFLLPGAALAVAGRRAWMARKDGPEGEVVRGLAGLSIMLLAGFLAFRLAQPDAFAGPGLRGMELSPRWWANMLQMWAMSKGEPWFPPAVQWAGRVRWWFAWWNLTLVGLGPVLGLAAWAAWGASWRELWRGRAAGLILPAVWVAVYFGCMGMSPVMTLRYYLPICGVLCLLAAWGLLAWRARAEGGGAGLFRRAGRWAWIGAIILTLFHASLYMGVLSRPHTRVEASAWMRDNLPPGAVLAHEHWDDRLPLTGFSPERFRYVEMAWYELYTPPLLDRAVDWLTRAGYIVLASNRLYGSIPRLPGRYPLSTAYYQALFAGDLGFEEIREFTSHPGWGPIRIPDQWVEEAFSVYDHPRVRIWQKTADFDPAKARKVLEEGLERNLTLGSDGR